MKYKTQYINTINELKQQLDSLQIIKPNDKRRLKKKVRLEFNYNSNHLEGNTLTYGQTELLLFYLNLKHEDFKYLRVFKSWLHFLFQHIP